MNFYLEEILIDGRGGCGGAGKRLIFPIIPDEVSVSSGANTIPINIIKTGEARIPRGEIATGYSWTGLFPGKSMKGAAFINSPADEWQSVTTIVKMLEKWKKNGTPLKFVCGKFINADVFIEDFSRKYYGLNHCEYSIMLTKYPTLTVSVSPAPKKTGDTDPKNVGKKGKVTKNVAYRSGPGSSYTKLGTLKKGTEVTIYAVSGNWYKIKEAGTGNAGGLIQGWGASGAIIGKLPPGVIAQLGIFGQNEWWVCATYVKITNGKPTKTGTGTGSGGGKKPKKPKTPTSSTGGSGGKKPIKVTLPTPHRTNSAPKMGKPTSNKPK